MVFLHLIFFGGGSTVVESTKIGISPLNCALVFGSGPTVVVSNKVGISPSY